MSPFLFLRSALFSVLAWGILALPAAASERTAIKHKINLPPSADLAYSIKAKQSGLSLDGNTLIQWHIANNRFSIVTETRAALLGKILEAKSEGMIGEYGLAPIVFTQKRFRKPQTTTTFDHQTKAITFTKSDQTYPIKGGEQDRSSAIWQLAAIARGAPAKFKPGSIWTFFVAGQSDAEPWSFKVIKKEQVKTPLGNMNALHIVRMPAPDSKGQQLDIWLAPSLEWYPVRLRFTEPDNDSIEQVLQKVSKK
ncbi:MAG: hypothetical protein A3I66_07560 [Burkholderiales bacterium RIFCSPLOWO2_02_FULL_57_36]|nr:MAG: hypothetical protein A3I66_07560 [Burkholderiales bacterium RIFCSPLOWO2_02_FULL_57_36]